MAKRRRGGAGPRVGATTQRPVVGSSAPLVQAVTPRWMWYLLAFSLGLVIAGQLGLLAFGAVADQRDEAITRCLEFSAGQPAVVSCPAASDSHVNLVSIPFFIGIAGIAIVLSQFVTRKVAAWMYRRRLTRSGQRQANARH